MAAPAPDEDLKTRRKKILGELCMLRVGERKYAASDAMSGIVQEGG